MKRLYFKGFLSKPLLVCRWSQSVLNGVIWGMDPIEIQSRYEIIIIFVSSKWAFANNIGQTPRQINGTGSTFTFNMAGIQHIIIQCP